MPKISDYIKQNRNVILLLILVVFGLSIYANSVYFVKDPGLLILFPPFLSEANVNLTRHLGAEYFNIAKALLAGQGYSSPFGKDTGPTAWMPPLYTFILALSILILKKKIFIIALIVFLQNIVLVITGLLVYGIAKKTLCVVSAKWAVAFYAVWLISDFYWFFQVTHDIWLVLLFLNIIYFIAIYIWPKEIGIKSAVIWGLCGGIAALASPVLGFVWCALCALKVFYDRRVQKALFFSLALFILINMPWLARNYAVFHKPIFIKSNLFYDAYQSNYGARNGLLSATTFKQHPFVRVEIDPDEEYTRLKETGYLDNYRQKFISSLKRDPFTYLRKVKNRFFAATLVYYPSEIWNDTKFNFWVNITHSLPFVCLLILLFFNKWTLTAEMKLAVLIYTIFLIPYILVTYYVRYALPLTALKVLFVCWGLDLIFKRKDYKKINKDFTQI